MTSRFMSILPVWVLAIVGVVLVAVIAAPSAYLRWLAIVFAGAILLSFVVQLGVAEKQGYVTRMMASVGGSLVILVIATAILGPLGH